MMAQKKTLLRIQDSKGACAPPCTCLWASTLCFEWTILLCCQWRQSVLIMFIAMN